MNKNLILVLATIFSILGSYLPVLFGDSNFFDGWSVLGGFLGGLFGIWLAVWLSKRYGF
jgi:hypothetical protein